MYLSTTLCIHFCKSWYRSSYSTSTLPILLVQIFFSKKNMITLICLKQVILIEAHRNQYKKCSIHIERNNFIILLGVHIFSIVFMSLKFVLKTILMSVTMIKLNRSNRVSVQFVCVTINLIVIYYNHIIYCTFLLLLLVVINRLLKWGNN